MVQNLSYIPCDDYFIPNIRLSHTGAQTLGKYGRMRRTFLEQNKPMLFNDNNYFRLSKIGVLNRYYR